MSKKSKNRASQKETAFDRLAKLSPSPDQIKEITSRLTDMDERALALVMAAQIDLKLEELLVRTFKKVLTSQDHEQMFRAPGSPLGNTFAKAKLCDAIFEFDKQDNLNLEKIRQIRNVFAHSALPMSFQDDKVKDLCLGLSPHRLKNLDGSPPTFGSLKERFWEISISCIRMISDLTKRHDRHAAVAPRTPS